MTPFMTRRQYESVTEDGEYETYEKSRTYHYNYIQLELELKYRH